MSSPAVAPAPRPRPNLCLPLALLPPHAAWLEAMAARHYPCGFASHCRTVRDLLLWAEGADAADVDWIFTTGDPRIAGGTSVVCGAGARDVGGGGGEGEGRSDCGEENARELERIKPAALVIHARLPRHACAWLQGVATEYTDGDLDAAFARLCAVVMALDSSENGPKGRVEAAVDGAANEEDDVGTEMDGDVTCSIFNVGDDELVHASSADLYCLLGIGAWGVGRRNCEAIGVSGRAENVRSSVVSPAAIGNTEKPSGNGRISANENVHPLKGTDAGLSARGKTTSSGGRS